MKNQPKVALVTGITGQDGSYLAQLLLEKGYQIHGLMRRTSLPSTGRIDPLLASAEQQLQLHYGDVTDAPNLARLIGELQPDEIYNLAAMSDVGASFQMPEYTANTAALGTLHILEAVRSLGLARKTRIYQASTSEMYGEVRESPQNENTPFCPRNPYAIAKLYAYWITVNYRKAYDLFACNGILFNHESPSRGESFVTRKITRAVARIALGLQQQLHLGNLDARRDWGYAGDYVRAMWMILHADEPDDWVIATGRATSVRDFVNMAFSRVGITLEFKGHGAQEKGCVASCTNTDYQLARGTEVVAVDPRYLRPAETHALCGDSSRAREKLGWEPEYQLEQLVADMVDHDLKLARQETD